jgi:hypothetical protein
VDGVRLLCDAGGILQVLVSLCFPLFPSFMRSKGGGGAKKSEG